MKNTKNKQMVFMIGSPASGKSTVAKELYNDYIILDCDEIKKAHPSYNPKKLELVHAWSSEKLESLFQDALKTDKNYIIDGTGSNSDKIVRRITEAQENNFHCVLVYVTCSLSECLKRNKARDRTVPESLLKEKYKDVKYSFEIVSKYADNIKVISNDKKVSNNFKVGEKK